MHEQYRKLQKTSGTLRISRPRSFTPRPLCRHQAQNTKHTYIHLQIRRYVGIRGCNPTPRAKSLSLSLSLCDGERINTYLLCTTHLTPHAHRENRLRLSTRTFLGYKRTAVSHRPSKRPLPGRAWGQRQKRHIQTTENEQTGRTNNPLARPAARPAVTRLFGSDKNLFDFRHQSNVCRGRKNLHDYRLLLESK